MSAYWTANCFTVTHIIAQKAPKYILQEYCYEDLVKHYVNSNWIMV